MALINAFCAQLFSTMAECVDNDNVRRTAESRAHSAVHGAPSGQYSSSLSTWPGVFDSMCLSERMQEQRIRDGEDPDVAEFERLRMPNHAIVEYG